MKEASAFSESFEGSAWPHYAKLIMICVYRETVTNQLMTFKGDLGTSERSPGTRRNGEASTTSKKKSTTTKGSDRKVAERLAKLRGDGPPTADEQNDQASKLKVRNPSMNVTRSLHIPNRTVFVIISVPCSGARNLGNSQHVSLL